MLKRTALFEEHKKLGGRLIDFGGWEMPVQYTGVLDEHQACRTAAGLFDVSHMGEVHVEGADAAAFLNYLLSNDVNKVAVGQGQYTLLCNDHGGLVDDLVIYRRAVDRFLVVVNASNTDKDYAHMQKVLEVFKKNHSGAKVSLSNESANYSQIALQGCKAESILQKLTSTPLAPIKTYWFAEGKVLNSIPAVLARTGYTGEDGFEIYVPWDRGTEVWRALLEAGSDVGLKPVGLGARDTLRMEMKYPLYGNELSDERNPLECGLGWVTKLDKGDFYGRSVIAAAKEKGLKHQLVGIKLTDKGIARHGYALFDQTGTTRIGEVTSGTQSPSLKFSIAIGFIDIAHAKAGTAITVDIRGTKTAAEVVPTPFYRRPY
ncbi:glycine cleavage system aminomethyltransferase GcvT [bacterium]|nr:glycine cleavage system aminomethyltransferase GcvT [bacterium]